MLAPAAALARPSPTAPPIGRKTPPYKWLEIDPLLGRYTGFHLAHPSPSRSRLGIATRSFSSIAGKRACQKHLVRIFNAISASRTSLGAVRYHYSPLGPTKTQGYSFLLIRQRGFSAFRHGPFATAGRRSWRRTDFRRGSWRKNSFSTNSPDAGHPPASDSQSR